MCNLNAQRTLIRNAGKLYNPRKAPHMSTYDHFHKAETEVRSLNFNPGSTSYYFRNSPSSAIDTVGEVSPLVNEQ